MRGMYTQRIIIWRVGRLSYKCILIYKTIFLFLRYKIRSLFRESPCIRSLRKKVNEEVTLRYNSTEQRIWGRKRTGESWLGVEIKSFIEYL